MSAGPKAARWQIRSGILELEVGGDPVRPNAEEIYGLVFDGVSMFRGQSIAPGAPPLRCSRYPAFLSLVIDHDDAAADGGLFCHVRATGRGGVSGPFGTWQDHPDHLIIGEVWYPLAAGAQQEIADILAGAGVEAPGALSLRQYLALRTATGDTGHLADETAGRNIQPGLAVRREESELISFTGRLYPYQKDGWQWLSFLWREGLGAILADEMGLGKTIQIIALLASPERSEAAPSLIVAPTTLLENWRREIAKFAPGLKTHIHQGTRRTGDYRVLAPFDVIITSYETVVRDGSMFRMIDWRIVVLDEAQAIKNPDTRRAQAVRQLRRRSGIAVTGTPVENRLRDLWSLVDFAVPGLLGDVGSFEQRFQDDVDGAAALEPLVTPIMLRRLVSEVAQDLPERIDIPQVLALTEDEAAAYEQIRLDTLAEYGGAATLVALTRLRMFCAHPMLLDDVPWTIDRALGFSKLARLFEIVDEVFASRQKLLVFTSYNRLAAMIADIVRQRYGAMAATINGETPVEDRQPVVDRFSAEAGPALLALNPRAAGAGLNITAATHVVHYNLEWNPAIEDQASARAHRRGQTRPVTVHRLFFGDSVEEVVNDRLSRKRELSGAAVIGVEGTDEDIADVGRALRASPLTRTKDLAG
ncbi:DEAD/DEAH box helicase [Sphingomonas sp. 179-A 2A2 NHS]|uniref:DEAD/DEAH box helicase n=1 Tax=Sphingomonas sp. 179-A 2A2 NHS TaxID=3374290 RepID=UPI003878FE9E